MSNSKILVAGANGMVGAAVCKQLSSSEMKPVPITRREADFLYSDQVARMYERHRDVSCVVVAAARVGGIYANDTYPARFIYENLMIEANLIHGAHLAGIPRLVFLGSSCIYPKLADQPMSESALLEGRLEPTNEPYAIAKIAGIKLCESYRREHGRDYRSLMPTNLYGPGDNFSELDSHVIPALMRKFVEARNSNSREVSIWGTGQARREFLHVYDLARAVEHFADLPEESYWSIASPQQSHINIGTGKDIAISELAFMLKSITGFTGDLVFDASKPDGTPRKLLDNTKATQLGWTAEIPLEQGLGETLDWYLNALKHAPSRVRLSPSS